ncbi:collagen alpha-1(I) chain-like [Erinaceus europaeus]|uniref:Collagen alpha-1(I) chain-like n=1 Tax=Erinaceus europaeus TaxID=9365 RepID=A0ABM3VV82_ERIEU|nr:collagen alpha-1(I) chain-like [Erinaceus europaeus]
MVTSQQRPQAAPPVLSHEALPASELQALTFAVFSAPANLETGVSAQDLGLQATLCDVQCRPSRQASDFCGGWRTSRCEAVQTHRCVPPGWRLLPGRIPLPKSTSPAAAPNMLGPCLATTRPQPGAPQPSSPGAAQPCSPAARSPPSPQLRSPAAPEPHSPSAPQPDHPQARSPAAPEPRSRTARCPAAPPPRRPAASSAPTPGLSARPLPGARSFKAPRSPQPGSRTSEVHAARGWAPARAGAGAGAGAPIRGAGAPSRGCRTSRGPGGARRDHPLRVPRPPPAARPAEPAPRPPRRARPVPGARCPRSPRSRAGRPRGGAGSGRAAAGPGRAAIASGSDKSISSAEPLVQSAGPAGSVRGAARRRGPRTRRRRRAGRPRTVSPAVRGRGAGTGTRIQPAFPGARLSAARSLGCTPFRGSGAPAASRGAPAAPHLRAGVRLVSALRGRLGPPGSAGSPLPPRGAHPAAPGAQSSRSAGSQLFCSRKFAPGGPGVRAGCGAGARGSGTWPGGGRPTGTGARAGPPFGQPPLCKPVGAGWASPGRGSPSAGAEGGERTPSRGRAPRAPPRRPPTPARRTRGAMLGGADWLGPPGAPSPPPETGVRERVPDLVRRGTKNSPAPRLMNGIPPPIGHTPRLHASPAPDSGSPVAPGTRARHLPCAPAGAGRPALPTALTLRLPR